jgi:hypothetical protein
MTFTGLGLIVLGCIVGVAAFVLWDPSGADIDIVYVGTTQRIAMTFVIAGIALLVYAGLRRKGRSIEEAYRLGYDVGFENGYRAGWESEQDGDPHVTAGKKHNHAATAGRGKR